MFYSEAGQLNIYIYLYIYVYIYKHISLKTSARSGWIRLGQVGMDLNTKNAVLKSCPGGGGGTKASLLLLDK
jgi:hypothetical protein